jgi:SMI1 / KNR4 family (SUKH-1)
MSFPLDIQFVNRAEAKLSRKLPLGYIARMCRDNGGEVTTGTEHWWLYPIFDDSDRKRLKRTCNDIVRETGTAREWPHFPPDALAIGHNGGGDQLVLLADQETDRYADAVYWWDHETAELNKVADAFEELSGAS